jgi:hypothetical protein
MKELIKGKNQIFLDKYHQQLIKIRNRLLAYKDCCDRKRLTRILEAGAEIARENNFQPGKPDWKWVLEHWKKTKYDNYYYFPNELIGWYLEQK